MFDIGFLELLIIGVVGLLVLGPERLPKAARTAGLWVGRIKRSVAGMQREISAQLEAEELRQKLKEQERKLNEGVSQAKNSAANAKRSVESIADAPPRDSARPQSDGSTSADQRLDAAIDSASQPTSSVDSAATSDHKDSTAR
ncbi:MULTISPECIES: Sec-independent protein translocase protein TatB [unclassified Halomonas]|uniref:Sec-independent protein translocase protein TatB n=1 Tax=unclassified Halomonas TaxID=2609666 RepID=UPI001C9482C7|nr:MULTISPECIES: Sec-independent protein translocase protein TatB [unclassified Halomonas]MBY5923686.1 Sec-independent protein translocase protein TatB [Halomonas sp. DP4Y7-2]MBY6230728.1 Sec-independent protein translocase protein TatB [Halomonas sp. DP4Y7-1]